MTSSVVWRIAGYPPHRVDPANHRCGDGRSSLLPSSDAPPGCVTEGTTSGKPLRPDRSDDAEQTVSHERIRLWDGVAPCRYRRARVVQQMVDYSLFGPPVIVRRLRSLSERFDESMPVSKPAMQEPGHCQSFACVSTAIRTRSEPPAAAKAEASYPWAGVQEQVSVSLRLVPPSRRRPASLRRDKGRRRPSGRRPARDGPCPSGRRPLLPWWE